MYQISQIRNNYNFDENCVVTEICALNTSNLDDNGEPTPNREVAIYKKFCQDKTEEEMEKFVSPFSLTSLCVAADMSADDVIKEVGKPFKRCRGEVGSAGLCPLPQGAPRCVIHGIKRLVGGRCRDAQTKEPTSFHNEAGNNHNNRKITL